MFQQIFGDALLFSATLKGYADLFPREKGYSIEVLCLPSVKNFLEAVVNIPISITLRNADFKRIIGNYCEFTKLVTYCESKYDIVIVPGSSASAEMLMAASANKTKIGLVQYRQRKWPPYLSVLQKIAYTEIKRPYEEMMVLQRHRFFLKELGLKDFQSSLP